MAAHSTDVLAALRDLHVKDVATTLSIWNRRDAAVWAQSVDAYRLLGERLIKFGEALLAFDVVSEGLTHFADDMRLRQLQASALARSGATRRANALLTNLCQMGEEGEETLGLLGRTHKDLADQAKDVHERQRQLGLAFEAYLRAYEVRRAAWPGINAATTAMLAGQTASAVTLAAEVRARAHAELQGPIAAAVDTYWLFATIAEASLLLEEVSQAEHWYGKAARTAGKRFGDLRSTRRNARLLATHLGVDWSPIDRALAVPRVLVFAGHMVDRPGRPIPRFPDELAPAVASAIRERIRALESGFAFASAACGSDILFHEAIHELGGMSVVVLPYDREAFRKTSVDTLPGTTWSARFDAVLERADEVSIASTDGLEGGTSYEYANLLLLGLAAMRAKQLDAELVALAVWDGHPGDGAGGTASMVGRWRALGHRIEVIRIDELYRDHLPAPAPVARPPALVTPAPSDGFPSRIVAMLFADAVGFSKLTDEQIPRFVRDFLGTIGALARRTKHRPLLCNTWGDGLYFVFGGVRDAGLFALDLCEQVGERRWADRALPESLDLRIALHTGPAYACIDPVTGRENFLGIHVSRAARIEPITPPGHVYASQAFAAIAAAEGVSEFTCDYVGQMPMAKGYGTFPTFHVRRR